MPNILTGTKGQQVEADSAAGPTSYPTGGFDRNSDLGRVDHAVAEIDNGDFVAHVEAIADNTLTIQVFSQGGNEVADATDLSANQITAYSYRL